MRKRIAILTLVVLMLITPFTSLAHAEVDTIRFRHMEWYITPEQFEENLRNEGLKFEMELLNLGSYWDWNTNDWKKEYSIHTSEHWYLVYEVKNPNEDSPLMTVADYKVNYIRAYFLPTYSIEKMEYGGPYKLAQVKYVFKIGKYEFNSYINTSKLGEQLSVLYGDDYENKYGKLNRDEYKNSIWYAKDKTSVSMRELKDTALGNTKLEISYGVPDDEKYFEDMKTILDNIELQRQQKEEEERKQEILQTNMDGL